MIARLELSRIARFGEAVAAAAERRRESLLFAAALFAGALLAATVRGAWLTR